VPSVEVIPSGNLPLSETLAAFPAIDDTLLVTTLTHQPTILIAISPRLTVSLMVYPVMQIQRLFFSSTLLTYLAARSYQEQLKLFAR